MKLKKTGKIIALLAATTALVASLVNDKKIIMEKINIYWQNLIKVYNIY